jgi:glycerol-3-phosphate acyltransferase PlsY
VTKISGLSAIITSLAVLTISIYFMFVNEQEYFILNFTHAFVAAILLLRHSSNVVALFENHLKR